MGKKFKKLNVNSRHEIKLMSFWGKKEKEMSEDANRFYNLAKQTGSLKARLIYEKRVGRKQARRERERDRNESGTDEEPPATLVPNDLAFPVLAGAAVQEILRRMGWPEEKVSSYWPDRTFTMER